MVNVNKMTSSYGNFNRKQHPLGSKTNDVLLFCKTSFEKRLKFVSDPRNIID